MVVDVLFGIGVTLNLLKGGDLFLRPHQKQRFQDWSETAVLRLEEARPARFLELLRTDRGQRGILLLALGAFGLLLIGSDAFNGEWIQAVVGTMSLLCVARFGGRHVVRWLIGNGAIVGTVLRYLVLLFAVVVMAIVHDYLLLALFVSVQGEAGYFMYASLEHYPWLAAIRLVTIWPTICYSGVLVAAGLGVFTASTLTFIAELLLKLLKGLVWRVVEYNRGAYAATLLLVTLGLGAVRIFIKDS